MVALRIVSCDETPPRAERGQLCMWFLRAPAAKPVRRRRPGPELAEWAAGASLDAVRELIRPFRRAHSRKAAQPARVQLPLALDGLPAFKPMRRANIWSIGRRPMTAAETDELKALHAALSDGGVFDKRPRVYGQCPPAGERCGYVSCRHHLGVDVNEFGEVQITKPILPPPDEVLERVGAKNAELYRLSEAGMRLPGIAAQLGMSEKAVEQRLARIRLKIEVSPELDINGMTETCSLRVADRGEHSTEEVAALIGGVSASLVLKIEGAAMAKFRRGMAAAGFKKRDD